MKPLTLRATLRLLGAGAIAYVAIIAVVIGLRIRPTAIALRRHSESVLAEYDAVHTRTKTFRATIDSIHPMMIAAARGEPAAAPERLRPWLAAMRARVDSLAVAGEAPGLASVPAEMRIGFAAANSQESRLGVALLEALANIELGRSADAARRLRVADSLVRLIDDHLAEAQRVGLVDLIDRERALADAATASIRALGWWLALGIVLAPLTAVIINRRLYDPLADLDNGLRRVAMGDLEGAIPVRRTDELGRLSAHFNETTALLRQRVAETRRRAQMALQESEERYRAIVELAPVGIAVVDTDGRYVHANSALERFLGYSETELRALTFRDTTFPDDLVLTAAPFADLMSGARDRFLVEKRYVRKDGDVVWGRLLVSAIRDADGAMLHTVSMIEDVTEEKLHEAEIRGAEERLRREQAAVVELARHPAFYAGDLPDAWHELTETAARTLGVPRVSVWLLDAERRTLRCMDLFQASGNRHSQGLELSRASFPAYFGALDEDRVIAAVDALGDPRTAELAGAYLTPLGITSLLDAPIRVGGRSVGVVCHEHTGPRREWSPEAQGFAGSIADLAALALEGAERARAERSHRKSEEKFAKAFRASPTAILITRMADGLLVDANDAFFTITGYAPEEAIGRTTRELVWPTPEGREAMIGRLKAEGRLTGLELEMRRKSGALIDVLVSVEIIELDGDQCLLVEALDITERKRAAHALRESEERYRLLVESSPDAVSVIVEGRIRYANPTAVVLVGARTSADLLGHAVVEFLAEESRAVAARRIERILEGELDTLDELRLRRLDGTVIDIEAIGMRIQFAGRPAVFVIHRDITARKQAERQIRLLAQAVKSTSEAITITDLQGRFTFANRAFLEWYGYTEEEVIGQTVALIASPRNPPGLQEEIQAATKRGGWTGELYNRRKDGSEFLIALATAEVLDPEGRVIALMGVSNDITDEKRAEERQDQLRRALLKSAADWTLTFDAVQYPILILDADGRIGRVNQWARALAGATSYSEVTDRTLEQVAPGEPWRAMADVAARARRTGAPAATQATETQPRRSWYVTATPVTVTGEEQRVIVIARDVTDLVQLQESLRRTETMSALGAVVAGVAHEVRNPLFAISATVDAFEARFGAQERHERYTRTLRQEVNRLSELMHGLLEYGKPPRLELAAGSIEPVVQRAVELCAALAEKADVRVVPALPPGLPDIRLDASRMLQVFENLIVNAIQHSPAGSQVTITAAAAREPAPAGDTWIEVTVADRGPGFRSEDLPHVFEPFFTRRRGGTGLGLSIVQRIVDQHGGEITARNRPDGGAELTVRLTAGLSPSHTPTPESIGAEAQNPGR